jgi:hypothetical protein
MACRIVLKQLNDGHAFWRHAPTFLAHLIQQHFDAGTISRLCDCGCQSFDLAIPTDTVLEPLMPASSHGGCALDLGYYISDATEPRRFVSVMIFVDARGYLSGIDVDHQANSSDMPHQVDVQEPPFHIHGKWLDIPSNQRLERP